MTVQHGDVLRVTVNMILPGPVQCQNVYHYLFDGVGFPSDATVVSDINDHMQAAYDELTALNRSDLVMDLSSVDEVQFVAGEWAVTRSVGTFTLTHAGAAVTQSLPYQSSPFVTLKTARPKSVGRKFLPPTTEDNQGATILVPVAVTAIVAYATDIIADITVEVVNALHPGIVRTGVDDYLVFTVAVVTNLLGSQKRRRPGEGA